MTFLSIIIAGLAGTLVMTTVMRIAPAMGMPNMDIVGMLHAGIKSGEVEAPSLYMINNGGLMSFVDGFPGHLIFAVVVYCTYRILIYLIFNSALEE